jgi:S-adenosylmethionine:tRNA ribosyltransferase-isomerase
MYTLDDYDYELPKDQIAQKPCEHRDQSRLFHLDRRSGDFSHRVFCDLPNLLRSGDALVVNNTKVIPGRLLGRKDTGGKAEVLILSYADGQAGRKTAGEFVCTCLIKSSKKPRIGSMIFFDHGLCAEVLKPSGDCYGVKFTCENNFDQVLYQVGKVPLPPYIRRDSGTEFCEDDTAYQTIYASEKGAIAAPTAGFHFSTGLIAQLQDMGIAVVHITLHVGYGTFIPVRVSDIRDHRMHSETYAITRQAAEVINDARAGGGRIVAVGTTSVRTLEFSASENGRVMAGTGSCNLFIYPGYQFKVVDAMITNFHLPRSTLLILVSAFAGRSAILNAYQAAIQKGYRFYSYGDAMLIDGGASGI